MSAAVGAAVGAAVIVSASNSGSTLSPEGAKAILVLILVCFGIMPALFVIFGRLRVGPYYDPVGWYCAGALTALIGAMLLGLVAIAFS